MFAPFILAAAILPLFTDPISTDPIWTDPTVTNRASTNPVLNDAVPTVPDAAFTLSVNVAPKEHAATPRSQRHELSLHWGTFGIGDSEVLFEGGLEYRFPAYDFAGLLELHPIVGTSLLADGGVYAYAGARHEWHFTDRLFLAPSFAAGIYQDGGVDLGGPLEFRSGLDLGARVSERIEASIGIYHLSNGGLYSINGGAESALFSLAFGL